jgi:hypothetical protein
MEEDIKILEEFIDDFKQLDENTLEEIKPTQFGEGQRYVYSDVYYAIENLIKRITKIESEVNETLAFEKFLLRKDNKPDEFNEGRFYIAQIIKDILNGEKEPSGKHKENKYITELDYIPKSVIKEKIEHYKKLQDDYVKKYDETNDGLQGMINILEELLEDK